MLVPFLKRGSSLSSGLTGQGHSQNDLKPLLYLGCPECSGVGCHQGCLCTSLHPSFPNRDQPPSCWKTSPQHYIATTMLHSRDSIGYVMSGAGVAFFWPLYHTGLIGGVLQKLLSFWEILLSPQSKTRTLDRSLLPFMDVGADCAHWDLKYRRIFLYPCPDLCLDTILSRGPQTISWILWLGLCFDMNCTWLNLV